MIERILLNAEINDAIERMNSAKQAFNAVCEYDQEVGKEYAEAMFEYYRLVNIRCRKMGLNPLYINEEC